MNLKESFRYQNFLSSMINEAGASLTAPSHCLTTTKNHLRNKVNDGATDMQETVDVGEFPANDSVLDFIHGVFRMQQVEIPLRLVVFQKQV